MTVAGMSWPVMQLAALQCSAVRARLGQARGGQNHDTGPGDR